jgi:hypothetical protein
MVVASIIGRGAGWSASGVKSLVREPTFFSVVWHGGPEQNSSQVSLRTFTPRTSGEKGATASSRRSRSSSRRFARLFLHLDTGLRSGRISAVNVQSGGMNFEDVRQSLREALIQKTLLGLDIAQYNPERDPDGAGAQKLVDLLVDVLAARLEALAPPAEIPAASTQPVPDESSS